MGIRTRKCILSIIFYSILFITTENFRVNFITLFYLCQLNFSFAVFEDNEIQNNILVL